MFFHLTIVFFIIHQCAILIAEPRCFEENKENIRHHLATKTPYRMVYNPDETQPKYDGRCTATRIWSFVRHGTRNPNRKVITLMQSPLRQIRDRILEAQNSTTGRRTLCDADVELFRKWDPHLSVDDQKELTREGEVELIELAERMQNRFPDLLPDVYSNDTYRFQFTDTQRTQKSFHAFATGLFGRNNIYRIWHLPPQKLDRILRFYKACPRWRMEVDKNSDTLQEVHDWYNSAEVQAAVSSVNARAGLTGLTDAEVHLIYTICAFETAWHKLWPSPWCTLFDANSVRAIEYLEDLEYYYVDGYGTELTYRQACPAFIDMMERIDPTSTEPSATFYFTHSGTMLKMLAHLGLYKDDFVLTHRDFDRPRQWRVSKIDAFASNLAFVLYNCTDGPYVLVLHQERPQRLNGCPTDSDLCPLEVFRSLFSESLENCNFDEMCQIRKSM